MAISNDTNKRLMIALTSEKAGNEVADAINKGAAVAAQGLIVVPAIITATNVSQTIDFGALVVGDKILHIPAVAGNAVFLACATAGTLPVAAVVGDLYVVMRALAVPAASTVTF